MAGEERAGQAARGDKDGSLQNTWPTDFELFRARSKTLGKVLGLLGIANGVSLDATLVAFLATRLTASHVNHNLAVQLKNNVLAHGQGTRSDLRSKAVVEVFASAAMAVAMVRKMQEGLDAVATVMDLRSGAGGISADVAAYQQLWRAFMTRNDADAVRAVIAAHIDISSLGVHAKSAKVDSLGRDRYLEDNYYDLARVAAYHVNAEPTALCGTHGYGVLAQHVLAVLASDCEWLGR